MHSGPSRGRGAAGHDENVALLCPHEELVIVEPRVAREPVVWRHKQNRGEWRSLTTPLCVVPVQYALLIKQPEVQPEVKTMPCMPLKWFHKSIRNPRK